jgi:hypothetical protein
VNVSQLKLRSEKFDDVDYNNNNNNNNTVKKGKAIPLQAWTGPEGFRG